MNASTRHDLDVVLDWITALRKGDLERVTDLLHTDVTWQGLTRDLVLAGRADVVDAISDQLPLDFHVDAIEMISGPRQVVVGTRSDHLPIPPEIELKGQIYNVFGCRDGRVSSIQDFSTREQALRSAGVPQQAAEWNSNKHPARLAR
jgi:ketosteroid isomerase-like protein